MALGYTAHHLFHDIFLVSGLVVQKVTCVVLSYILFSLAPTLFWVICRDLEAEHHIGDCEEVDEMQQG